eukprot:GHVR01149529.1.p1 GENE.GHVR01149529.1~~GHVR01149529.1.p1  ORF type:complete len:192 (+),score=49.19 GHVR01149529.1:418-993(+)
MKSVRFYFGVQEGVIYTQVSPDGGCLSEEPRVVLGDNVEDVTKNLTPLFDGVTDWEILCSSSIDFSEEEGLKDANDILEEAFNAASLPARIAATKREINDLADKAGEAKRYKGANPVPDSGLETADLDPFMVRLIDALSVIVLDYRVSKILEIIDPQALKQCLVALGPHAPVWKKDGVEVEFDGREWVEVQ